MFEKIKYSLLTVLKIKLGKKVPLRISHICTFKCNLKCKYCGRWKSKRKEMKTGEIKKAMKEFSERGTRLWDFTGGEPLLRKDIGELVAYAKDLGFSIVLVTNGLLIKRKIKEIKKVDVLDVSLDGPKPINDKLRGRGTFDKIMEGIKIAKENGVNVHLSSVISRLNTERNCYGIRELLNIAINLNCPIFFQPLYESEYNKKEIKKYFPSKRDYIQALEIIKKFKTENPFLLQSSDTTLNWFEKLLKGNASWKCLAGKAYAFLFPDGLVAPCFFKEHLGLNGLKYRFSNAFDLLPLPEKDCKCGLTCCVENNFLYSLNPNEIFSQFKRLRELK